MVKLLEGAQCPLKNGEYVVKHQTHKLPNVSIPSFIKNVSKNLSIKKKRKSFTNRSLLTYTWYMSIFFLTGLTTFWRSAGLVSFNYISIINRGTTVRKYL